MQFGVLTSTRSLGKRVLYSIPQGGRRIDYSVPAEHGALEPMKGMRAGFELPFLALNSFRKSPLIRD